MSGVELWFGTPLYANFSSFEKQKLIQKEVKIAFDELIKDNRFKHNPEWNSHLISDIEFKDNVIQQYNLKVFSECLAEHLKSYLEEVYSPLAKAPLNYKITASWLTLTKKGMYARAHTHGEADISGVYYYQTTGEDGNIFFNNPNQLISNSLCFKQMDQTIYFKPKVGRFILFPGWLQHAVQTNTTDNDRVSLSFNILFNR